MHCFTDRLRDLAVPVCLNAPVKDVQSTGNGYSIALNGYSLTARRVLLATGGVSYPKTGSVGDGQKFARCLGHRLQPYRPGLVGVAYDSPWLRANHGKLFKRANVRVFDGDRELGHVIAALEIERWGLGGPAISNATRLLSRTMAARPALEIQPGRGEEPIHITMVETRPLKEAMVTVGGVDLGCVDPATMESRVRPGLYFAGEVLDVDGPTGGYNLTAAFSSARLAVESIAGEAGIEPTAEGVAPRRRSRQVRPGRTQRPERRSRRSGKD